MAHEHFEVCDCCRFRQKTPSHWSSYDNPLKGWAIVRQDGGTGQAPDTEFCPTCVNDGKAAGFILTGFSLLAKDQKRQSDEGKRASGLDESVIP